MVRWEESFQLRLEAAVASFTQAAKLSISEVRGHERPPTHGDRVPEVPSSNV